MCESTAILKIVIFLLLVISFVHTVHINNLYNKVGELHNKLELLRRTVK